jgi:hypothetical protein
MPLIKSKSDKAFKSNIKAEVAAGKPVKQAVAIAYSTKRAAKKATGGAVDPMNYDSDWDYKRAAGQLKDEDESETPERSAIQKYKDKKYVNRIVGQEKVGYAAKLAGDKETAEKMAGRKQRRLESGRMKEKAERASKDSEYGKAARIRKEWSEKIGGGKPAPFNSGGSSKKSCPCW